jgi:hypothetical protein
MWERNRMVYTSIGTLLFWKEVGFRTICTYGNVFVRVYGSRRWAKYGIDRDFLRSLHVSLTLQYYQKLRLDRPVQSSLLT